MNADDKTPEPITVQFAFNPPTAGGPLTGNTVGSSFDILCVPFVGCFQSQWPEVTRNDPLTLNFGNAGQFTVALSNETFAAGRNGLQQNHATVDATVTYTAVPIPSRRRCSSSARACSGSRRAASASATCEKASVEAGGRRGWLPCLVRQSLAKEFGDEA